MVFLVCERIGVAAVLVVDDSPVVRRALARALGAAGLDVREAASVDAARRIDLRELACAVIDLQLADGDGADLAEALIGEQPAFPVAFFTSGAPNASVERARAHGPVFLKPDTRAVLAWVERIARTDQPPPTK